MIGASDIGRRAWLAYLALATPAITVCGGLLLGGVWVMDFEDVGPLESPPVPEWVEILAWISIGSWPCVWLAGFLGAHRLDLPGWRVLPFLANLLPVSGLGIVSLRADVFENGGFDGVTAYLGLLALLLVTGLGAAMWDNRAPGIGLTEGAE